MTYSLASNNAVMSNDKKLPGDLAMWFFILAELTVFAIFFIAFAVTEQFNSEMFVAGKAQLHTVSGLINTIALITSSYFVALSLVAVSNGNSRKTVVLLVLGMLAAGVYMVVKLWEYSQLFSLGIDLETNTFFTLYFLITAFHFLHVVLGIVILMFIAVKVSKGGYSLSISGYEAGASYWHMVDLVWIILFPLIYVI
ncbi:cytochrome c oxidase subunit 3 family protein [Thalassotalea atypica]|uniref:cytochrome c oxidase subunit 3 family protein n=1 Tax=Thalassotalea atypica TaxID=2054316 RepID=UPI002574653A|nr:cytochrome c oxidase subunit 3 family protein [Thalassotalea atypica]